MSDVMSATEHIRSTPARERAADAIRSSALECAITLLTTGGAKALSVRSLADALGTSTKIIYSHFGGMPQVIAGVYAHAYQSLLERLEVADDINVSRVERLWRVARGYREYAMGEPHLFALLFEQPAIDARREDVPDGRAHPAVPLVSRIIAPANTSGATADTARLQAHAFCATVHGPVELERSGWLDSGADHVFDTVVTQAIRAAIALPARLGRP